MMHTINELYKIDGAKFYTADYIIKHNIPKAKSYNDTNGWSKCYGLGTDRGTKNIHTADGVKVVYTYGEKTYFDTAEERDAYRVQQNIARAELNKKNKLLKAINSHYQTMSVEELEEVLNNIKERG